MHVDLFMLEVERVAGKLDRVALDQLAEDVAGCTGRIFILGLGGSAANASHAAADLRKLCEVRALCPTDNMAEFSARANDEGFDSVFTGWMRASQAGLNDALLVLSVGGGTEVVSKPITDAVRLAKELGMRVLGIVGPNGGVTAALGDTVLKIPSSQALVTPITEAFQAVVWHALVSHPLLQKRPTKW